MNTSFLNHGGDIPLDTVPLAPPPGLAQTPGDESEPGSIIRPEAEGRMSGDAADRLIREISEINSANLPQNPKRRRPLTGFAQPEERPSFYLSLSDLMSLLLVFFVLIFSLTTPGAPIAQPTPEAKPKKTVTASLPMPKPGRPMIDPIPMPAPVPKQIQVGLAAVAEKGQADPGLTGEPEAKARRSMPVKAAEARRPLGDLQTTGFLMDRALLTLVTATAPLPPKAVPPKESSLSSLLSRVSREMRSPANKGVELEQGPDRLVLRLPEAITFDVGRAEIKPAMKRVLRRLAKVLSTDPECPIVVTGHTDDVPIHNEQFASNWELSAARAASVARALMDHGNSPNRFTIRGLADQKPRVANKGSANRQKNRRVEIELRPKG